MSDHDTDMVSRRAVLAKGLGVVAVVASLTAIDVSTSEAQKKMAPKMVQYQQKPKGDQKCSICLHFVPPDSCKLVEGKINPEGWCSLFAPKPKETKK
jgi:hypothetical protein